MLDVLRSLIIIPLIYLYTVVMGVLALLLSLVDRKGKLQHGCARVWCRMIAVTAGARMRVRGLENIPSGQPCVFIANHQSYLDIPALFGYLPVQFRIMAKRSLFFIPFLGWFLWRAGHIPVDRENARAALANIHRAVAKIHAGYSTVVFPEGTRSADGSLREFRSGGFKLALKAGVPIVPVTIIGTCRVLRRDSLVFHPGEVEIVIDPPLPTQGYTNRTLPELIQQTRARIASHLGQPAAALFDLPRCARVDS
jgi:1-acyl-sn-glycerol-3-phosphate acyltransferase